MKTFKHLICGLTLSAGLALLPARVDAKLRVVATIETLGDLARQVGGERVAVESLSHGYQDPHFVQAKPSLVLALNRGDVLLYVGLELEVGWLPTPVQQSRNGTIQTGPPGTAVCRFTGLGVAGARTACSEVYVRA